MEIILLERVEKLGDMGDVVRVRDGFARNYLLPQQKALRATPENREKFEHQRKDLEKVNAGRRSEAENASAGIDGKVCILIRQASEAGHLYGSVSARDIAESASGGGVAVERHHVQLDRPIKALGTHPVRVFLHPEVPATVQVVVARSEAEAEMQIQASTKPESAEDATGSSAESQAAEEALVAAEEFFEEGAGPLAEEEAGPLAEKEEEANSSEPSAPDKTSEPS